MSDARARLIASLAAELAAPVSAEASALADAIRARHGEAVAAVVLYGSCLRRRTAEGVHDFYVVVDRYRAAYRSRALAAANALLPPNVFYVELRSGDRVLRAKYAVLSLADLARCCRGDARRSGSWARFAQPMAAAFVRSGAARDAMLDACADAVCTAVRTALADGGSTWQTVESAALWRALFRSTYSAELRPEREGASDAIYTEQPTRFDARLEGALALLEESGVLERAPDPAGTRVRLRSPMAHRPPRAMIKVLSTLQLLKSAATFGDWVPYALWKLERHSGVRLEPSERQRRHPWLFAWPLVFRALRTGALR
jgi:hypothetical protein